MMIKITSAAYKKQTLIRLCITVLASIVAIELGARY